MSSLQKTNSNLFRNTLSPFLRKSNKSSIQSNISSILRLDQLLISTDTIRFQCRGTHNQYLYNRELKITNKTGTKITFKIKSNNPENYEVVPFRETLDDGKSYEIRIRVAVNSRNITKCNLDRFVLQWGKCEDNTINVSYTHNRQLRVRVDMQNLNQDIAENAKKEEKDLIMLQELLNTNREKIKKLNAEIERHENMPGVFVVTKGIMLTLGLISFFLGLLIM